MHFNSTSKPLSINQTGKYVYLEYNSNKEDPKFVMVGTITVRSNNNSTSSEMNKSNNNNFNSIALLMVPTKDVNKQMSTLVNGGIDIKDQYSFKDLRETKGGGMNQTLLILASNKPLNHVVSVLERITPTLPYS